MEALFVGIGYFGSFILAAQYILMMIKIIDPNTFYFYLYNFLASVFILMSLFYHTNYPSLWIEIFWFFVSIYGMIINSKNMFYLYKKEKE